MTYEQFMVYFSKRPKQTQEVIEKSVKLLADGFSGQIRWHCYRGHIQKPQFVVGEDGLKEK